MLIVSVAAICWPQGMPACRARHSEAPAEVNAATRVNGNLGKQACLRQAFSILAGNAAPEDGEPDTKEVIISGDLPIFL
jgi:hypothetical protein